MPKNQFRRGFIKDCEEMSLEFRKELGIKPEEYLSGRSLAEDLGIGVFAFSEVVGKEHLDILHRVSGLTMIGRSGKPIILFNDTHAAARTESTIMHEIAHNVLNHSTQAEDELLPLNLVGRLHDAQMEREAEVFGSILQVPEKGMYRLLATGYDKAGVAGVFRCSTEMVLFRFRKCGFEKRLRIKI